MVDRGNTLAPPEGRVIFVANENQLLGMRTEKIVEGAIAYLQGHVSDVTAKAKWLFTRFPPAGPATPAINNVRPAAGGGRWIRLPQLATVSLAGGSGLTNEILAVLTPYGTPLILLQRRIMGAAPGHVTYSITGAGQVTLASSEATDDGSIQVVAWVNGIG